jgi:hypothetical protein
MQDDGGQARSVPELHADTVEFLMGGGIEATESRLAQARHGHHGA